MFDFLNLSLFDLSVKDLLIVVLFVLLGIAADKFSIWLLKFFRKRELKRRDEECSESGKSSQRRSFVTKRVGEHFSKVMLALEKPLHVFCVTVGCGLGLAIIDEPAWGEELFKIIRTALEAASMWCLIWFLLNLIKTLITPIAVDRAKKSGTRVGEMLVPILMSVLRVTLFVLGILFVAQNMGYSITSLLAGLGLGGAAIALASKDTIANVFGSFVILFDHPFEIGDWVTIGGISGTVEDISIRSVKIRTFDDTLVSIPNQILTTTQIDRRGKVKTKMDCSFGVLYSTTEEQLRNIIQKIEQYIESHPDDYENRKHYVHFDAFGNSSLNVTVVAYTKNTTYKQHVKSKEEFMFAIMRIVRESGTDFAFPTRTLEFKDSPIQIKMSE